MIPLRFNKIRSVKKPSCQFKIKIKNELKKCLDWYLKYNF